MPSMEKTPNTSPAIAVSACLLGRPCRYDGSSKPVDAVMQLARCYKFVPICPEVAGGLPVPHPPCEIVAGSRPVRVMDTNGDDVTQAFHLGASRCRVAVLKSKSPSCGSGSVYDGSFTGALVPGWGVAAQLFRDAGITVLDESQVHRLDMPLGPAQP